MLPTVGSSIAKAAGWRLERVLSENGNEFRGAAFREALEHLSSHHSRIHAVRPQTAGHVEALQKTIHRRVLETRVRALPLPAIHRLRRELDTYLTIFNNDRVHHRRLTQGRIPANIVHRVRKMEAR